MSFMRLPHGCSIASQQVLRALKTSPPYRRGAPRLPRLLLRRRLSKSTLLACFRSHPVTSTNSSSNPLRAFRPVIRPYLPRIFLVYSSTLLSLMLMARSRVSSFLRQR